MAPDKITAKNLSYDQTLPPFLARLRGQQAAATGHRPDPLLAARRRATRVRTASEEAEDAPLVLDADGNVVDGTVGRLGLEDEDEDEEDRAQEKPPAAVAVPRDAEAEAVPKTSSEKVASIGAAPNKKRKMGRVIGGGDEDENPEDEDARRVARAVAASRAIIGGGAGGEDEKTKKKNPKEAASAGLKKKKAKKIKLSFGEDEDAAG